MTDEPKLATLPTGSDHGVAEHAAHVQQDAAAGNGLAVVSIAKSYDKRVVLSDVSLSVGKGEVVGLLGPNGAGKPTRSEARVVGKECVSSFRYRRSPDT